MNFLCRNRKLFSNLGTFQNHTGKCVNIMENQGIIWSNYQKFHQPRFPWNFRGCPLLLNHHLGWKSVVWIDTLDRFSKWKFLPHHPLTSCCRSTASRASGNEWINIPPIGLKEKHRLKKCVGKGGYASFPWRSRKAYDIWFPSNQTAWMNISFDELWGLPEKSHGPNSPTEWGRVHSLLPRFFDDHLPPEN